MSAETESHTRLHGRWLLTARLAWVAVFITLTAIYAFGFLAVHETLTTVCEAEPCTLREQIRLTSEGERIERSPGPPVGYADRLRPDQVEALETLDLTLNQYGWLGALQLGLPALVLLLIAGGLFWWKSDDWMALFASIMVATFPIHNMPLAFTLMVRQPDWEWVVNLISIVALSCLLIFPLIFPTGQFVPRWTRWMAIYNITGAVIASFLGNTILEVFGDVLGRVIIGVIVVIPFGIGVYAQLYRYFRVARPAERQQFKWVVVGLVGTLVIQFGVLIPLNALLTSPAFSAEPALVLSAIPDTLWQLNNLLIAVCIVISVLRYRLWEVDIFINRAMVYSSLTAMIAGLYILVVGSLISLMQNQNDLAAMAVALLVVAALVQPLRRALQNGVNRLLRFDPSIGNKPRDAIQLSSELSGKAREEKVQLQEVTEVDSSTHTRLHGRWLLSARVAWVTVFMLSMIVYAAAAPVAFHILATPCTFEPCMSPFQPGPEAEVTSQELASLKFGAWYHTTLEAVLRLLTLGVGLFIFWNRSDDWMALLASIMLVATFAVFSPSPMMLETSQPLWQGPIILLRAIGLASTVGLFYLLPDGRFMPRWTRWLALALLALIGAFAAAGAPFQAGLPVFLIALVTGAGFQIYRYRKVSSPIQRQQTKWIVFGIVAMVVPILVFFLFAFLNPSLNPLRSNAPILSQGALIFTLMLTICVVIPLCFLPVTLAFSILRYRLWDVDILINRTLVYGALTTSVVALYILIVGWSSIGLQTQNNLAGSVFAILVIAFLFRPLRQRLQRIADRFVPMSQTVSRVEQHKHQIAIPESQATADTRLRGRWLLVARLSWVAVFTVLTAMYVFGFLAVHDVLSTVCEAEPCTLGEIRHTEAGNQITGFMGPPIGSADRLRSDQVMALDSLNLTLDQYSWLGALQMGIPLLIYLLIAAGLFWRKSDDWMVLFVSTMIMTFPLAEMPLPYTLAVRQPVWQWVYVPAFFVAVSTYFIFPLVFPTGQPVPRWTRWKIFFDIAFAIILTLRLNSALREPIVESGFVLAYLILSFCTSAYALSYRYFHVASRLERQQIKWVVVGVVGFISIAFPLDTFLFYHPMMIDSARALVLSAIPDTIYRAVALFIPVSVAISVLHYRLWDIDILINRTLVYGALTGVVVTAFVILVGFLSILFQSTGNSIIAIVATGLMALLFNPLRQRLQRGVNRLMYGERDEPYTALSRLSRQLETTLAPESVLPTIVTTVRDVLRLPYVAIYLQQDSQGYKIVAESASPSLRIENGRLRVPGMNREGRCIPLVHQGDTIGYIVLGPRAPNEAFSATDLRLLEDLAPQVGVAVHAARLTADLQRSREQLVLAREEERRRLRRDLHDDLAPTLASLGLTASTAADMISTNPTTATKLVKELQTEIRATVGNIRRLVYDLRPPTLDELGLLAAVRERAAQYSNAPAGIHVTVDALAELPALPAAVEVAAYRIVQEALENVSKHSQARTCSIRFANHNGLEIEITDDGIGLPQNITPGVGLRSMRERAEELGGSCMIERRVEGGTRVLARLPNGEFNGTFARSDRG